MDGWINENIYIYILKMLATQQDQNSESNEVFSADRRHN